MSDKPVTAKRVRFDGGVREESQEEKGEEERVVYVNEGAHSLREQDSSSQDADRKPPGTHQYKVTIKCTNDNNNNLY